MGISVEQVSKLQRRAKAARQQSEHLESKAEAERRRGDPFGFARTYEKEADAALREAESLEEEARNLQDQLLGP